MTDTAMVHFGSNADLLDRINASEEDVQSKQQSFGNFVQFNGKGDFELSPWSYGPKENQQELHPDNVYVVNPQSMKHGWAGFADQSRSRPKERWTSWVDAFPPEPTDWLNERGESFAKVAYKFECVCVHGDAVGLVLNVNEHRGMKAGFSELEGALRDRIRRAMALPEGNEMRADMLNRIYPVVQLKFQTGINTRYGPLNKAVLQQLQGEAGWAGKDHATAALPESQAEVEEAVPARRRRRTKK